VCRTHNQVRTTLKQFGIIKLTVLVSSPVCYLRGTSFFFLLFPKCTKRPHVFVLYLQYRIKKNTLNVAGFNNSHENCDRNISGILLREYRAVRRSFRGHDQKLLTAMKSEYVSRAPRILHTRCGCGRRPGVTAAAAATGCGCGCSCSCSPLPSPNTDLNRVFRLTGCHVHCCCCPSLEPVKTLARRKLQRHELLLVSQRTELTPLRASSKLIVPYLAKKFLAVYRSRRFITAFTTARHRSLS
jgi:hypothetical protein